MNLRHTILGLFFFATLAVLAFFTIYLGDWNPFVERSRYVVYFASVDGLRPGDQVQVYGLPLGQISSITFDESGSKDPNERLRIGLTMDRALNLREDHSIRITNKSLLGGRRIEIEEGIGAPIATGKKLFGSIAAGPLDALENLVDDNRGGIQRIVTTVGDLTESLSTGEKSLSELLLNSESHEDLTGILRNADSVVQKIDSGDGTLAKLLNDPELHTQITGFFDSAGVVAEELRKSLQSETGTLARLLRDEEIYENLRSAAENANTLIARLEAGEEGLVARLLGPKSNEMYADLETAVDRFRELGETLTSGEGPLPMLFTDAELATELRGIVADVSSAASRIDTLLEDVEAGRGTIGYLLRDDSAARDLQRAVNVIVGAVEDAREAAPVASISSFLFGSF